MRPCAVGIFTFTDDRGLRQVAVGVGQRQPRHFSAGKILLGPVQIDRPLRRRRHGMVVDSGVPVGLRPDLSAVGAVP